MSWMRGRLGDLADLSLGKMLDKVKNKGVLRPYLANVNVRWGAFDLSALREMRFEERELERYGIRSGDIVMCEGGEPGRCAIWREQLPGMMLQKALHRVRAGAGIDHRFLFYSLTHKGQTRALDQYFTGSTIKHLPNEKLALVEVEYPPIEEQRRIADILSAYDDLIDNNTRRIVILEEMAKRTFEEWFVRFRFPGHERVRMRASDDGLVPETWERSHLSDLCKSIEDGDWVESKDQGGEDFRLLQISNVGINRFVETGNYRFISRDTFTRLRCREIVPGQILIARMPTPIGRAWLVTPKPWKMITAVDVAIAEAEVSRTSPEFLLHFLNSEATLAAFATQASGTTRLRITRRQIAAMRVLAPPPTLAHQFSKVVGPMNALVEVLTRSNEELLVARNLLLPKLITGELEVSAMSVSGTNAP
ncbi:MAG: restriction endonuclease subunit S [Gemmatimonadota bacterium]